MFLSNNITAKIEHSKVYLKICECCFSIVSHTKRLILRNEKKTRVKCWPILFSIFASIWIPFPRRRRSRDQDLQRHLSRFEIGNFSVCNFMTTNTLIVLFSLLCASQSIYIALLYYKISEFILLLIPSVN